MIQTWALLKDAYRELNAKKLFWITVIISGLIVAVYAAAGINERGVTFLRWTIPAMINSKIMPPALFYKFVFDRFGIAVWLAWAAMVLAMISTASIIPDFVLGGAVELTLSKPISRVRLFLTKYFCGLLFVALQVAVFTTACFLVIGIRGKSWEPHVFLAVPIVVAVFSYIYCVSALVGLLTRSTIASVLLAALFWFLLFMLNNGDSITLSLRKQFESQVTREQSVITRNEGRAKKALIEERTKAGAEAGTPDAPIPEPTHEEIYAKDTNLASRVTSLEETKRNLKETIWWNTLFVYLKTPLPKTTETTKLLDRYLISDADLGLLKRLGPRDENGESSADDEIERRRHDGSTGAAVESVLRSRSLGWVLGTSLAFEALVLALTCWIFVRKDF